MYGSTRAAKPPVKKQRHYYCRLSTLGHDCPIGQPPSTFLFPWKCQAETTVVVFIVYERKCVQALLVSSSLMHTHGTQAVQVDHPDFREGLNYRLGGKAQLERDPV